MRRLALRDWIGIALIFTFCSALTTLFLMPIPQSNEQLITYMLGQLSGFVSSVVALHYVASKNDEDKTANTGKAFDAITATANASGPADGKRAEIAADQVADAAVDEADRIKGQA